MARCMPAPPPVSTSSGASSPCVPRGAVDKNCERRRSTEAGGTGGLWSSLELTRVVRDRDAQLLAGDKLCLCCCHSTTAAASNARGQIACEVDPLGGSQARHGRLHSTS